MPFSTEITSIKAEIASGLAASQYTAKDLVYVSKAIEALSNAEGGGGSFQELTTLTKLYAGPSAANFETSAALTNPVIIAQVSDNNYSQIAFKNTNSGSSASTDFIAYSNNGDDNSGWIDMGITSSTYSDPSFTVTGPGDGYIFVSGSSNGSSDQGNLVLATDGTGTQNKIIFAAGGLSSNNTQMSIIPDDRVHIEIPSPSTSPSTGALTVVGGVGIQGDVNIAGNITFGGSGTTVSTNTLSVADPLIFVGTGNTTDAVDLGLIAEYGTALASTLTNTVTNKALTSNVATLTTGTAHSLAVGDIVVVSGVDAVFNGTYVVQSVPTSTTFTYDKTNANVTSAAVSPVGATSASTKRRFAGVVRDASDGVLKVFKDATVKPTGTVNFAESGLAFGDLRTGAITASSATIGSVTNTEIGRLSGVTSSIQTQLDSKSPLSSPTFTGTVTLPAQTSIGTVTANQIGYLSGVSSSIQTQLDSKLASATAASTYAPLASPSLTGTPLAPTAAVDTNTTQIATTAYVVAQGYLKSSTASSTYLTQSTASSTYAPLIQTPDSSKTFSANNYNLAAGDKDKIMLLSNGATAGTVTVPSGIFAVGSVITIVQTGTGQLTLTQNGTTINSQAGKLKLNGQYASCQLICTASNTFLAIGNLVA